MSFRSVLAESAQLLLETEFRIRAEDVVEEARARHPDLFAAESDRLAVEAASKVVKEILRELSQDDHTTDEQLNLPHIVLPTAIAVEREDGSFEYVKTQRATRKDMVGGEAHRVANVLRAQRRLDQYRESLDLLLPVMTDDEMTVEEALRILGAQGTP